MFLSRRKQSDDKYRLGLRSRDAFRQITRKQKDLMDYNQSYCFCCCCLQHNWIRSPTLKASSYPIFLSQRFHRPICFQVDSARIQIPTGTSVTTCNHKYGLILTCRHVHVRLHRFILTEACLCRLELAYFARKISKNRLVCKNAVAVAYYRSCRLLVMGSCNRLMALFTVHVPPLHCNITKHP